MHLGLSLNFNQSSVPPVEIAEITALLSATSAMYDPSDLTTLWQDDARTTQVTADGQAVAVMDDISGNGNHMKQTTALERPLYKTDGTLHWLEGDGIAYWMRTNPFLNLGETWTHIGAWRADAGSDRFFATSFDFRGAPRSLTLNTVWYNSAGAAVELIPGDPEFDHVMTIVQESTTAIYGRYNGTQGTTIIPYNDSASAQGLALFTMQHDVFSSGLDGPFYGGLWDAQIYTTPNIELVERFYRQKAGL